MTQKTTTIEGPVSVTGDFKMPYVHVWGFNLTRETMKELIAAAEEAGTPRLLAAVAAIKGHGQ